LRRDMRKPKDMKVCNYYQNIVRINNEEIPNLPPFQTLQKLSNDELTDIILFGNPKSWQNKMDRQGFDPMEQSLFQVIDFMEQVKSIKEPFDKPKSKDKDKDNKKKNNSSSSSSNKKKPTFFCSEHGPNFTHDTKKELAGLVQKAAKKEFKKQSKELASISKKRKSDDSSDEDNDDKECFLLETLTKDIEGFNYKDMEGLKIEDDNNDDDEFDDEVSC
jgi:hypothetical protein